MQQAAALIKTNRRIILIFTIKTDMYEKKPVNVSPI